MVPSSFRALRWLERLNVAAVGLSLAAATSAALRDFDGSGGGSGATAVYAGLSTLLLGTIWARLLRNPRTVGNSSVRVGWLLSIPLAAANAGLAAAALFGLHPGYDLGGFVLGFIMGVTFGAIIWGPALLLTLLCYGLPIAWAQRSARLGLAGQERGEVVVGSAAVLMALAAVVFNYGLSAPTSRALVLPWFTWALAAGAVACGGLAVAASVARARRRRAFVAEVEAGRVERYRIETTDEGRALVRVVVQGGNYRVTDVEEEVAMLDREGLVTRAARS